jgi:RNA polymerase sigma factor (sigma-70 family)
MFLRFTTRRGKGDLASRQILADPGTVAFADASPEELCTVLQVKRCLYFRAMSGDEANLLLRYAQENSQEAFRELVHRYFGLVYHTALRRLNGNAALAQEAAQDVFVAMGRKARAVAKRPKNLVGWLHVSACYAAANLARQEARISRLPSMMHEEREGEAARQEWEQMRPEVDLLLLKLTEREREALLLRFFEGLRFTEMADRLGLTEEGTRMRVDRALEKLRRLLARRGIASSTAVLTSALAAFGGQTAPAALPVSVAAAALSKLSATAGIGGASALGFLIMNSTKTVIVGAAIALAAAGTVSMLWHPWRAARSGIGGARTQLSPEQQTLVKSRLASLQSKVAALSAQQVNAAVTSNTTRSGARDSSANQAASELALGRIHLKSLSDLGSATPREAVESLLWAIYHQSVDNIAEREVIPDAARGRLEAIVDALPPDARADYPDPEHIMALYGARDASIAWPQEGTLDIVSDESTGPAAAHVTLQFEQEPTSSGSHGSQSFDLQATPQGWKVVVPPWAVNNVANWLSNPDTDPGLGKK